MKGIISYILTFLNILLYLAYIISIIVMYTKFELWVVLFSFSQLSLLMLVSFIIAVVPSFFCIINTFMILEDNNEDLETKALLQSIVQFALSITVLVFFLKFSAQAYENFNNTDNVFIRIAIMFFPILFTTIQEIVLKGINIFVQTDYDSTLSNVVLGLAITTLVFECMFFFGDSAENSTFWLPVGLQVLCIILSGIVYFKD